MFKYIILGVVQGLTEFFPISSSAHLIIAQKLLGILEQRVFISVVLHLGTTLALIVFFFKDIVAALRNRRALIFIAIAVFVTAAIGIPGKNFFESLFASSFVAALGLIFSGVILILTRRFMQAKRNNTTPLANPAFKGGDKGGFSIPPLGTTEAYSPGRLHFNYKDAFVLGLAQGLAIVPGISRSGVTISALLFRRLDKETSFRLSFIASIPIVLGAILLKIREIDNFSNLNLRGLSAGFIFSFVFGIIALKILKAFLEQAKLHYFGYYCILLAVVTIIFLR